MRPYVARNGDPRREWGYGARGVMQIRKSVCVRGGVWRAGGASDEQALQTQWFTASSDICLSLCLSGPHGRVAWRVAWSRGVAWHGVWRVVSGVAREHGSCAAAPRGLLRRLG